MNKSRRTKQFYGFGSKFKVSKHFFNEFLEEQIRQPIQFGTLSFEDIQKRYVGIRMKFKIGKANYSNPPVSGVFQDFSDDPYAKTRRRGFLRFAYTYTVNLKRFAFYYIV